MSLPRAFVGLDIGGTYIKGRAFDANGKSLAEESAPTGDDGTTDWQQRALAVLGKLVSLCPGDAAVGVAAPGLPARDARSISYMPGRLKGLEGLKWQNALKSSRPVPVLNDAQAALMGEVWMGAARGATNVFLLTLGTGVGGAAMVDGRVLRGHLGRAGHLGHVSLDPNAPPDITNTPGSLEDTIGGHNLLSRSSGRFKETRELVAAFRDGSAEAAAVWLRSVRALAAAIAGFINVLDPEKIVIGGGIADANEALFEPLGKELDRMEWRPGGSKVTIVKAALGRNAGATGAAYAAKLESEPA